MVAPGWVGIVIGVADLPNLEALLADALERAYRRAVANAEGKAAAREKFGALGEALADTRLHPIEVRHAVVPAVFRVDPRSVPLSEMVAYTAEVSRAVQSRTRTSSTTTSSPSRTSHASSSRRRKARSSIRLRAHAGSLLGGRRRRWRQPAPL